MDRGERKERGGGRRVGEREGEPEGTGRRRADIYFQLTSTSFSLAEALQRRQRITHSQSKKEEEARTVT